jgi:hypothetical protein
MVYRSSVAGHLRVEVKHRCPAPNRYTWAIVREHEVLPLEESCDRFGSWEEASQAGKEALKERGRQLAAASNDLTRKAWVNSGLLSDQPVTYPRVRS